MTDFTKPTEAEEKKNARNTAVVLEAHGFQPHFMFWRWRTGGPNVSTGHAWGLIYNPVYLKLRELNEATLQLLAGTLGLTEDETAAKLLSLSAAAMLMYDYERQTWRLK